MRENVSFEQCNFSYEAFLGDPKVGCQNKYCLYMERLDGKLKFLSCNLKVVIFYNKSSLNITNIMTAMQWTFEPLQMAYA